MASQFEHVRPGDVITSDLLNRIIDKLNELEGKIGTGGGGTGGQQIITRLDPEEEQAAGQPLTIFGNFDFPLSQNTVTIDQFQIPTSSFLPGSSNAQISFIIPTTLVGAGGAARPVTIRVKRSSGQEGQQQYMVLPQVQSTVPDPTVNPSTAANPNPSNFTNSAFGGTLRTGEKARIAGQNLSPGPTVAIRVQTGPNTFVTYPDAAANPARPAPTIDSANSNNSQVVFTVPTITEFTQGIPGSVIVEVSVPGAVNKASVSATVMRIN
jgi:hypothetical protein